MEQKNDQSNMPALRCSNCGCNEIYYYQGVPAQDTFYAYEVDLSTGSPGNSVDICPRMGRVDRVEPRTFYLCHECMKSWVTWDQCKQDCLPNKHDSEIVGVKSVAEVATMATTNSAQPANNDQLRAEYSKRIASGELDPAEVSFAAFVETMKPKELNFKELYSKMIAEGKIDPTATSFDEVQTVGTLFLGKEEGEYKLAYSQGIASGEIDPVETTYDEIVRIANFVNAAAKALAKPVPTTEEFKKLYAADIGSGKINPAEVSFDSFVANYGK